MRLSRFAFIAFLAIGAASGTPATAAPIVLTTPGLYPFTKVTAIDGLMVGGKEYNVTFEQYASDQTFQNNVAGAKVAADAIDAALDSSIANALYLTNEPGLAPNQFVVEYAVNYGIRSIGYSAHDWEDVGYGASNNSAVFSLVSPDPSPGPAGTSVPEPTSFALIGTALVGLGFGRLRTL